MKKYHIIISAHATEEAHADDPMDFVELCAELPSIRRLLRAAYEAGADIESLDNLVEDIQVSVARHVFLQAKSKTEALLAEEVSEAIYKIDAAGFEVTNLRVHFCSDDTF